MHGIKKGDLVISKNDWEKGQIGLVLMIEKKKSGWDNILVRWENEKYEDVYPPWYLQVINGKENPEFDEEKMWMMWGDQ